MRVLVTGASGVLGNAVYTAFKSNSSSESHEVIGTAHSRAHEYPELKPLNLLDKAAVEEFIKSWRPNWVVHCAAERRPDVAERDPEAARQLNVSVTSWLGQLASRYAFKLVYISTDYVFDGTNPPYAPSDKPNPLQLYGETKRAGEVELQQVDSSQILILRVPVLYGPAPKNSDSAVNILLDVVQDQSGKIYKMDHYATRYPTNVIDIANFLVRLSALPRPLPNILHYSTAEPFTKYEICLVFAKILGLPHSHIIPDAEPPTGSGATTRPRDCHLNCAETEALGVEGGMGLSGFEEWWTERLRGGGS